jgi:hypothetical protein
MHHLFVLCGLMMLAKLTHHHDSLFERTIIARRVATKPIDNYKLWPEFKNYDNPHNINKILYIISVMYDKHVP